MKNQYFGDIKDYLKYGLLRCFSNSGISIGVCWMLTPDDGGSDGNKTKYLTKPDEWRSCDPELFDALFKTLKGEGIRDVLYAENHLFPLDTTFFRNNVPDDKAERLSWFEKAKAKLAGTDLVFFDPDKGIEVPSMHCGIKGSSQYIYRDELAEIWGSGTSLLVFQHFARKNHDEHITQLSQYLAEICPEASVFSIESRHVLFLLACHEAHRTQVDQALTFLDRSWSRHMKVVKFKP